MRGHFDRVNLKLRPVPPLDASVRTRPSALFQLTFELKLNQPMAPDDILGPACMAVAVL